LPEIVAIEKFLTIEQLEPPEPVIKGLLYPGCKMVLGASSKGRKSWALLDLALSCALGLPWLGMPVTQGNALYINFELKPWMLKQRLEAIAEDRGLALDTAGRLEVWNLRGHAASFSTLVPMMIARIHRLRRPYSLIVMDPLYKGLGDCDENAAGDINRLMNELERLCDETSAALAIAHHFAKGDPWEKEPMDRLSGSGVFGREPDSLLVLTGGRLPRNAQDQREGVVTKADKDTLIFADAILRACPPIPQFRLRWQRYHFRREDGKVTTYRLGSYASKYGQTLAGMPRLVRKSDAAECEVCGWIAEKCTVSRDEAAKVFDNLRKDCYGLLAFEGEGVWVGTDYLENNPF
jgi:RecA-family ATPase